MLTRRSVSMWPFLAFVFLLLLSAQGDAQNSRDVARLSADKETYTLIMTHRDGSADTLKGQHDDLGLLPADRAELAAILAPEGLVEKGDTIPIDRMVLTLQMNDGGGVNVLLSVGDSARTFHDLRWASGKPLDQVAGEFWPENVFCFDATVTIGGELGGNLVVVGGDVVVREGATIRGNVTVLGGILRQRGDGKIYGQIFAPNGHRRPRLSVSRAWEFEEGGLRWTPVFSYDRVDGARPGVRADYQASAYSPGLSLTAAYAFSSKTWQYRFRFNQRLIRSANLELKASVFRLTQPDGEAWVGTTANTVYAILAGSDYRDYVGQDGGELGVTYKYRDRGVLSATYRTLEYRLLDAHSELWHLFRPDHDFRANFSTVPESEYSSWPDRWEERSSAVLISVGVESREDHSEHRGFDGLGHATLEIAGGALGGKFDYSRLTCLFEGHWSNRETHRVTTRLWYGAALHDMPPDKYFYLGGVGSMPGYPARIFVGDQAFLGTLEYRFNYWQTGVADGGIIVFADVGRATFEDDFFDLSHFKSDVGIGFGFGEGFRIEVAKGLDDTDRDLRVTARLSQGM